jgi:hypothetical protein
VLNGNNSITKYPAGSSGDVIPTATLNVLSSGESFLSDIAVSAHGKLYVVGFGHVKCRRGSCQDVSTDEVAVYPSGSDGDTQPSSVISGPDTRLASPSAVALDRSGNIYVANDGGIKCTRGCCTPSGAGSITVYPPGSNGDVMPIRTITGAKTGLVDPYRVTLDSNGNIYVLNALGVPFACAGHGGGGGRVGVPKAGTFFDFSFREGPILIFAAGSDGDTAPSSTIGGPLTTLHGPSGIAVGPGGP